MTNNKISHVNRRCFNKSLLTAGMVLTLPWKTLACATTTRGDGLIQMKCDGKVYLYSGVGHVGEYGDYQILHELSEQLGCSADDIIMDLGKNPMQLPTILAQHTNHLSYSDRDTILRAGLLLAQERKKWAALPKEGQFIIDDGISKETADLVSMLDPEGIIVATKAVI